ncbi:hypothetical protein H7J87_18295 [Mycolicibacterium wolinskyi]|uniref:Uncharacterized protein n=1 Tax=Mycolicibacterium wolinskyi TaxID=59750 RepID=A0A1X2EUU3_9MYCO|nr:MULTISPECIES: hypothetical protein [Mycolicibacterium]MCV7287275.1 hypothetical protein [Mycolicibacterium wolinskyi]MCV7292768.1 hypothetical protein [Mycolicibacterium goodii]ORX09952.1 hypothetical protein AWC31_07075 [Mycolicibacterium wolinskyi]
MSDLYAHYYVRAHGDLPSGEVYVKVYDFTTDDRARVLSGARLTPADDLGADDCLFEFLALVRDEDLHPAVQVQNHVQFCWPT